MLLTNQTAPTSAPTHTKSPPTQEYTRTPRTPPPQPQKIPPETTPAHPRRNTQALLQTPGTPETPSAQMAPNSQLPSSHHPSKNHFLTHSRQRHQTHTIPCKVPHTEPATHPPESSNRRHLVGGGPVITPLPHNSSQGHDRDDTGKTPDNKNQWPDKEGVYTSLRMNLGDTEWLSDMDISYIREDWGHQEQEAYTLPDTIMQRYIDNLPDQQYSSRSRTGRARRKGNSCEGLDNVRFNDTYGALIINSNNTHWRVLLGDGKLKRWYIFDPMGETNFTSPSDSTAATCLRALKNKFTPLNYRFTHFPHQVQPTRTGSKDGYLCGVWALWIVEHWYAFQYTEYTDFFQYVLERQELQDLRHNPRGEQHNLQLGQTLRKEYLSTLRQHVTKYHTGPLAPTEHSYIDLSEEDNLTKQDTHMDMPEPEQREQEMETNIEHTIENNIIRTNKKQRKSTNVCRANGKTPTVKQQ